jgi:prephenate dehydrogenase
VVGLVEALGAKPLFLDPSEHDSYAAAMHYLPIVMSSAFVTTTAGSDGWREMHKLAEAGFSDYSQLAANDPMESETVCLSNPDALVHWLDKLIIELYAYRNHIKSDGQELLERFVEAWELRWRWEAGAVEGDDNAPRLPSASDNVAQAFFGEALSSRLRGKATEEPSGGRFKYKRRGRLGG